MKKSIVFLIGLMFFLVASLVSCQVRHDSPQTVIWDAVTIRTGMELLLTEVSVIPFRDDKLVPTNYIVLGTVVPEDLPEFYVDLEANGLIGRYVIAARFYLDVVGLDPYFDDYGYSDDPDSVISIDGVPLLFTIEFIPRLIPTLLRIQ